jgi:hypothetical protein
MESFEREDVDGGAREGDELDALLWRFRTVKRKYTLRV